MQGHVYYLPEMKLGRAPNNSAKNANFSQPLQIYSIVPLVEIMENSGMDNRQNTPTVDSHFKVLVVDDHPNTAHMLARAIARLGKHVEVVSATNGLEALQQVENGGTDILITDMMMPEMTGMELIEMLNNQPAIAPTVMFLLTAHDSAGVREIAQQLNVREVISKPVSPERICQLIVQTMAELERSKADGSETNSQKPEATHTADSKQECLEVSQLLWDVAKKFQLQANVKNQLLVVGQTEAGSKVQGNVAQLRQALRTLVWNAIQNTPKGGTVILSSEKALNKVKILVRDTGYGIVSADIPEIEDGSETTENIGDEASKEDNQELVIVKSIAEQHDGNITVESEAGKGTCFTLSLPLYEESIQVTMERNL